MSLLLLHHHSEFVLYDVSILLTTHLSVAKNELWRGQHGCSDPTQGQSRPGAVFQGVAWVCWSVHPAKRGVLLPPVMKLHALPGQ